MEISEQVFNLINILFTVILYSLIISSPFIILTLEMYAYDKYKKWKNTEEQEFEMIITGKTERKNNLEKDIQELDDLKRRKALDVELLDIKLKALNWVEVPEEELEDAGGETDEVVDETSEEITSDLSINELKTIAKKRGLTGYSKKNKEQLIELLQNTSNKKGNA